MDSQKRKDLLKDWLSKKLKIDFLFSPASSDASFRRYFRVKAQDNSFIVMDAPPQNESIESFLKIAKLLSIVGVNAPEIYEVDKSLGFILMKDFGDKTYLDVLNNDNQTALYTDAINSLIRMQKNIKRGLCQSYSKKILIDEMGLFIEWYLKKYKSYDLNKKEHEELLSWFEEISIKVFSQEKFFVHRDFHSRNLMILESKNPGILDFQDALEGPITYDLVSLLRDCYITLPEKFVSEKIEHFYHESSALLMKTTQEEFIKDFDLMGIQRHLKAVGIFSRLKHRDQKENYILDIPRTRDYLIKICDKYDSLQLLSDFLREHSHK